MENMNHTPTEHRGRTSQRRARSKIPTGPVPIWVPPEYTHAPIIDKAPIAKRYIIGDVRIKDDKMIAVRDIRPGAIIYHEKYYLSWIPTLPGNLVDSLSRLDRKQMHELFQVACVTPFSGITHHSGADVVGTYLSSLLETTKVTHRRRCYFFPGATRFARQERGNCGYNIDGDTLYIITKRCILQGEVCSFTHSEPATTEGTAACAVCGMLGQRIECGKCNRIFYCSDMCRSSDSRRHQPSCVSYVSGPPPSSICAAPAD